MPVTGNSIEGGFHTAALDAGSVISAAQKFYGATSLMEYIEVGTYLHNVLVCDDYVDVEKGNWFDITGFLGLQFLINGETHYGWAAVSVVFVDSKIPWTLSATLTGYAYETVADQPIVAGQISGP